MNNNNNYSTNNANKKEHCKRDLRHEKHQEVVEDLEKRWWRRTRIHIAILGLAIGVVNCYAQATFCMAIVEMVLPADFVPRDATGPELGLSPKVAATGDPFNPTVPPVEDQSCPIEYKYRDYYDSWRFPTTTDETANSSQPSGSAAAATNQTIDVSNRFDWDASQQGLLLGAFAVGTAPLQVFGGRLAEIYGAKWVLLLGCLGTAVTNLSIPLIAHFSFALLVVNRVLMGVAQAGMEPGLMCLLAEWLTPAETGFFISMLLFAICIGFFLGSLCSSFILALGYGWPLAYYVSGGLNLVVGLLWFVYADSWPRDSKFISIDELNYIERQQQKLQMGGKQASFSQLNVTHPTNDLKSDIIHDSSNIISKSKSEPGVVLRPQQVASTIDLVVAQRTLATTTTTIDKPPTSLSDRDAFGMENGTTGQQQSSTSGQDAPWMNILGTRSVWAFIVCKISVRWCADVLSNELPLYLANVLHLSIKLNGILNSVSSALFAIFSFITGWLVNEISQQGWTSIEKTTLRKIFQSVASFGAALCVFLMTRYDCNIVVSMSMLLMLSSCLVMGTGGELQIPYDMTSKYPGTLHGMACTLSISGWLAPPLIGLILGDQPNSRSRWHIVWYLTATINLIGGLVFVLFADASPRDFDSNSGRTMQHHDNGHQDEMMGGGYDNNACKRCDNSPQQSKRSNPILATATAVAADEAIKTNESPRGHPLINGSIGQFDSKPLLRIRQPEEGFILPGTLYPANMDSPLFAGKLIAFPYQLNELPRSEMIRMNGHMAAGGGGGASDLPRDQEKMMMNLNETSELGPRSSWLRPMLSSLVCWSRDGRLRRAVNGQEPTGRPTNAGTFLDDDDDKPNGGHDHPQPRHPYDLVAPIASPFVPLLPIVEATKMAANNIVPPLDGPRLTMADKGPLVSPSAFHQQPSSVSVLVNADADASGHHEQQQYSRREGFGPANSNNNRPPDGTTTRTTATGPPASRLATMVDGIKSRRESPFVANQLLQEAIGSSGSSSSSSSTTTEKTITHL